MGSNRFEPNRARGGETRRGERNYIISRLRSAAVRLPRVRHRQRPRLVRGLVDQLIGDVPAAVAFDRLAGRGLEA
eukprot:30829-Pelagococcus_subviridis.AAC.4